MSYILHHQPGQLCTVLLETQSVLDGYRADTSVTPTVERVIFPSLALAGSFPQDMTRIDTGLYRLSFTLPALASSVGTYVVDIEWLDPDTDELRQRAVQVVVTAPFGTYSASVG